MGDEEIRIIKIESCGGRQALDESVSDPSVVRMGYRTYSTTYDVNWQRDSVTDKRDPVPHALLRWTI